MTIEKSTNERLFEHYHTYTRRPAITDPLVKKTVFKSFQRTIGPWLPADRASRILDVACGEGAFLSFLRELGYSNLFGFDLSPENVNLCHGAGLGFVEQFDALRLTEWQPSEQFDAIFGFDIIEHLPKQAAAGFLERIRDRLRPGGCVVLQTPNMGSLYGCYQRYYDLSHEFGLTEKTALDIMHVAGFPPQGVQIRAAWNATTFLGHLREWYLRGIHLVVFLAEGANRPRIPTANLLIRAIRP